MSVSIINDVKNISLNKYVEYTEYLSEYLFSYPQVISVYQMGGWTQPGISDIDLIVVVKALKKEECKELNLLNKALARNKEDEYMLMHAPFVITEEAFKNLNLFFYCSDLKRLKGKELEIKNHPNDLQELANLYKLVSVLVHTYPRFYSIQKRNSLRSFLTFGYSLKHTYRIIKEFDTSFSNLKIEEYIQRMTDIRKSVIESHRVKQSEIDLLIKLGIATSKVMLSKVNEIIIKKNIFKPGKSDFLYIKNFETVISFVRNSTSFDVKRTNDVNILELPHSFAVFVLIFLNNRELKDFQSRNIVGTFSLEIWNKEKELLDEIATPFIEYYKVFHSCMVFNGMSFELNTPFIWDSRKYRFFNILDYGRRFKYNLSTKRNKIKVFKIINKFSS